MTLSDAKMPSLSDKIEDKALEAKAAEIEAMEAKKPKKVSKKK